MNKKKILSLMMAVAMTLSVSAFSAAIDFGTETTTAYADENSAFAVTVTGNHILYPGQAYPGSALVGQTINLNAQATGANSTVTYTYNISGRTNMGHGDVNVTLQQYGSYDWTPEYPGEYAVKVTATDLDGNTATDYIYYRISNPIEVLNFEGDHIVYPTQTYPGRAVVGETIQLNAQAVGGVGETKYSYSISGRTNMGQGNINTEPAQSGLYDWTPEYPGEYAVIVTATDKDGNTASKTLYYAISNPLEIINFTGDHQNPNTSDIYGLANVGDSINFSSQVVGGVYGYTYTYKIFGRNGQAHPAQYFTSADGSLTWTPDDGDLYAVELYVTDAAGHSTSKQLIYSIAE